MPKTKTHKTREPFNPTEHNFCEWSCLLCVGEDVFRCEKGTDIIAHLSTHGYDEALAKTARGGMMRHLDAKEWSQSEYEYSIDNKPVIGKVVRATRSRNDPMRYDD